MESTNEFINFITNAIQSFGYIGIFIAVFLEYACLPLPSEILLPFIGLLASYDNFGFIPAIIVSIVAGLIGSTICYILGYFGGAPIIEWLTNKSPSTKKSAEKINSFLEKYEKAAVFLARLLPLTRTYISIAVGAVKMKYSEFILYSFGGITIWNIILISLGYFLGENTDLIQKVLKQYSVIALLIGLLILIFITYKLVKKYKKQK